MGKARHNTGRPRVGGERHAAAMPTMAVEGRGRREVDLTCGPHMSVSGLTRVMVIWTFCEPINKFGDLDLPFWEFGDRNDTRCQVQGPRVHFTLKKMTRRQLTELYVEGREKYYKIPIYIFYTCRLTTINS